ncbi:MAG: ribonuclease III [Candidatus Marinamargulisbacteria bacterium]|nr:ribonuclease III [Candidatus Marinamargulisbacteria bacterium]
MCNKLLQSIGIRFKDIRHLNEALTHASHGESVNNERLEFFGDAVLKLVVSEYLVHQYPDYNEGQLTQLRAWLISDSALHIVAKSIALGDFLRLSKSERRNKAHERPSLLANAFEALIGAIYLDQGLNPVQVFLKNRLDIVLMPLVKENYHVDHKSELQERMQKSRLALPLYTVVRTQGTDHNKIFVVSVSIVGKDEPNTQEGSGRTKKSAEQSAAKAMLHHLDNNIQ